MRVYKTRFAILFFFLFALPAALFAFGRQDKKIRTVYNQNWTLNITQFDVSAMPPSQAAIGGVVTRSLASRFSGMSTKLRKGGEYDYYWNVAWQNAQS